MINTNFYIFFFVILSVLFLHECEKSKTDYYFAKRNYREKKYE